MKRKIKLRRFGVWLILRLEILLLAILHHNRRLYKFSVFHVFCSVLIKIFLMARNIAELRFVIFSNFYIWIYNFVILT